MKPPFYYQTFGTKRLVTRKKAGLISPPGSGKTRMTCDAMTELDVSTGLIVCSGSAIPAWKNQIPEWMDIGDAEIIDIKNVQKWKPAKRQALYKRVHSGEFKGFIIMTYACYRQDHIHIFGPLARLAGAWDIIIADEYHKAFRNKGSNTFKVFKKLVRNVKNAIIISGTAVGRHPGTLWTLFHLCDPEEFSSYWKFVNHYCLVDDENDYGTMILGPKPSTMEELKMKMDEYFAYIPEEIVASQLPEGLRSTLLTTMTTEQQRIYKNMVEDLMVSLEHERGSDLILIPNTLALVISLRQLLCCPKLVNENLGMGGGYETILDELKVQETPHAIIFVPFKLAVPMIAKALREEGYDTYELRGGVDADEQQRILKEFGRNQGVLVCTIQYAESFDCETCDTSYFLGYVSNLDQLKQAEGRTRRAISEHKFVTWRYINYSGTIDDHALDDIEHNLSNIRKTLQRPKALIDAIKGDNT